MLRIQKLNKSCSNNNICSLQTKFIEIEPQHRKWRRIHGFQLPLHPQQIVGWICIILLTLFSFTIVVQQIPLEYHKVFYFITGFLYTLFLIFYFGAELIDPAHPDVKKQKSKQPVPEFDKSIHEHVIENGRCHLCNINITESDKRTKHCR